MIADNPHDSAPPAVVIEVEVPDFVAAAIERVATRNGVPAAEMIREAVRCSDWFQREFGNG